MRKQLKEIIRRVEAWPAERQKDAARVLLEMEAQARSTQALSEEQIAEVKRRRAGPERQFLSLADVRSRFAKRGA